MTVLKTPADFWTPAPLNASFFIMSNALTVCHRCPTIRDPRFQNFISQNFAKWIARGVYFHSRRTHERANPLIKVEVWLLC